MAVTAGIKSFSVDGVAFDVLSLDNYSIKNSANEVVEVIAGTPGLRVVRKTPQVSVTVSWRNVKVSDYLGSRDRNVVLVTQEGRTFVWPDAAEISADATINTNDGAFSMTFASVEGKEIV